MVENINVLDLLKDEDGNEIKEITEIKEQLINAGIPTETVEEFINSEPVKNLTTNVLNSYKKEYDQQVPIYSAIKINGKKLYEYARENIEVELPTRKVNIYDIELLKYEIIDNKTHIQIRCNVSKGTYIRSLIRDIGNSLNTCAIMTDLRRTKLGNFNIEDSINIKDIKIDKLHSIEEVLKDYKQVEVTDDLEFKIKNGCKIENIYNEKYVLFKNINGIIGLYRNENNMLKPYKMF